MDVAQSVRDGKVSSVELVEHAFKRIAKHNPTINAIVSPMKDEALDSARKADEALAKGVVWGPLHGVPCTIKDQFEIKGVITTCGSPQYKDHVAESDAVIVERMRKAGAVIIGHTNVPLFLRDWQSYNDVYGTTKNPHDLNRSPGGSSGGCGAAVAAGLSMLSIGSDFAGSIRIPAHFNGIYGHRPSIGLVTSRGSVPRSIGGIHKPPSKMGIAGPIARSAKDLRLALEIIGGPDEGDDIAYSWSLPEPRKKALSEYKIGYVIEDPLCPSASDLKKVLVEAMDSLKKTGASMVEGWPAEVDPEQQYNVFMYHYYAARASQLSDEAVPDTLKRASERDDSFEWLQAWSWTAPHKIYQAKEAVRFEARNAWQRYFKDFDVFMMPVDFVPTFPHDHSEPRAERVLQTVDGERRYMDQLFWLSFGSITGLPCTVAPIGYTDEGLPVGIQILGPFLEDATPIHVAELMAEVVGGYTPLKGYSLDSDSSCAC